MRQEDCTTLQLSEALLLRLARDLGLVDLAMLNDHMLR